jgi:hypothetical protein
MQTSTRKWKRLISYSIVAAGGLTALWALGSQRKSGAVIADTTPTPPPSRPYAPPPPTIPAEAPAAQAKRPQVEIVFAVDTTGSMASLIEGAKRKIWGIASFVAKGQPTPDLRVGLVAYRDVGDAYVTKVYDLDDDLDRVYSRLRQFRADGGGDVPEHVARAMHQSVHGMSWTQGQDVLRLIYLVGDAPAHTDYEDGFSLAKATRAAAEKGIQVHAIRCGSDLETEQQWRKVAMLGKGQFMTLGQDGGMRDERTPFDEELAELHDKVSDTVMAYGAKGGAARRALSEAAAAPAETKAERAGFLAAKKKAVAGEGDLVDAVATGAVAVEAVPPADLPPAMRPMSMTARKAHITELIEERGRAQARIKELVRKRDEHIASRPRPAAAAPSFDAEVAGSIAKSEKSIGIAR